MATPGVAADPIIRTVDARSRGAPYARTTVPSTESRRPIAGPAVPVGSSTSIAAVASSTTMRRPVASSSVAGAVTRPWIVTLSSWVNSAFAIEIGAGVGVALGVALGVAPGEALGEGAAPVSRRLTSLPSRNQIR
ncbi:MAG: hypothetical protein E6J17_08290 [Chloroflexi bacterium]|nr:MAG: hypothetical protein E6J17_08290 [Chloroflexota bacterium]